MFSSEYSSLFQGGWGHRIKLHSYMYYPVSLRPESKKSKTLAAKIRMATGAVLTLPVSFSSAEDFDKRGKAEFRQRLQMMADREKSVPAGAGSELRPGEFYIEFEPDFAFKLMLHNIRLMGFHPFEILAEDAESSVEEVSAQFDLNAPVNINRDLHLCRVMSLNPEIGCIFPDGSEHSIEQFLKYPVDLDWNEDADWEDDDGSGKDAAVVLDHVWRLGEDFDRIAADLSKDEEDIIEIRVHFDTFRDIYAVHDQLKQAIIDRAASDMRSGLVVSPGFKITRYHEPPSFYIHFEPEFGIKCLLHNLMVRCGRTQSEFAALMDMDEESAAKLFDLAEPCAFRDYWHAFKALGSELHIVQPYGSDPLW